MDIAELVLRIEALEKAVAERDATIAKQAARIADLEEQLAASSSNSGKPPSQDTPEQRKTRREAQQKKARNLANAKRRRRGGQPGHKGKTRDLVPPDQVDETHVVRPAVCGTCSADLFDGAVTGVVRHQVAEIPPVTPVVTEYQRMRIACPECASETLAELPPGVHASRFGANLTAWIAVLVGAYRLSRRQVQRLLEGLLGVDIALGTITACEHRASAALEPIHKEICSQAAKEEVVYVDASGWNLGVTRPCLWVVASGVLSLFSIVADGTRKLLDGLLGGPDQTVVVCDRATVFNHRRGSSRQTCWAHLLRYFAAMSERAPPSARIGRELVAETLALFSAWHVFKRGELSRSELQARMEPFKERFRKLLERGRDCKIPKTTGTCANILDEHWDALWTFLIVEGVEPTNNHAEQQLRTAVLWRRTSFGSQCEKGLRFTERMLTVVQTCRKQCKNVHVFVSDAIRAHWEGRGHPSLLQRDIAPP